METDMLFVYGLLMKKANHEMGLYLSKNATFVSEATFRGRLYRVSYYPGVVPSNHDRDRVKGEVFKLSDPSTLEELDLFEGINPDYPAESEYTREIWEVKTAEGGILPCWIYLYNWAVDEKNSIRSGDFLESQKG